MRTLQQIMDEVFDDPDLTPEQVPALDLYMDQVLTLFNDGLQGSKHHPDDKLLTKTMIHNYSKEKLLSPIHGKKYSHQHIMQMLCVYQLKQMLALGDVGRLTGRDDVDFEAYWRRFLADKKLLRDAIPAQLSEHLDACLDDAGERLRLCLALSAISVYMRRLCEKILDEQAEERD